MDRLFNELSSDTKHILNAVRMYWYGASKNKMPLFLPAFIDYGYLSQYCFKPFQISNLYSYEGPS